MSNFLQLSFCISNLFSDIKCTGCLWICIPNLLINASSLLECLTSISNPVNTENFLIPGLSKRHQPSRKEPSIHPLCCNTSHFPHPTHCQAFLIPYPKCTFSMSQLPFPLIKATITLTSYLILKNLLKWFQSNFSCRISKLKQINTKSAFNIFLSFMASSCFSDWGQDP